MAELLKEIAPAGQTGRADVNPSRAPIPIVFTKQSRRQPRSLRSRHPWRLPMTWRDESSLHAWREPGGGLMCPRDAFNLANRKLIVEARARYRVPAIYGMPGLASEGGLIYYNTESSTNTGPRLGSVGRYCAEKASRPAGAATNEVRLRINMQLQSTRPHSARDAAIHCRRAHRIVASHRRAPLLHCRRGQLIAMAHHVDSEINREGRYRR